MKGRTKITKLELPDAVLGQKTSIRFTSVQIDVWEDAAIDCEFCLR